MNGTPRHGRLYVFILAIVLLLWVAVGDFDAVEAPYVGF